MSHLVRTPEDRFSRVGAHLMERLQVYLNGKRDIKFFIKSETLAANNQMFKLCDSEDSENVLIPTQPVL